MALLALFLCVVSGPVAQAQSQAASKAAPLASEALDLPAYEARLEEITHQVSQAKKDSAEISALRKSLPREWAIRSSDGLVHVSTGWLADELAKLGANSANTAAIARGIELRLAAMRGQAAALEKIPAEADTESARARLDKIFQGREYRGLHGPTELELLMVRISRWIGEQILRLLSHLHLRGSIGNVVVWIVIALAFGALAYGVWRYLSSLARASEFRFEGQFVPSESRQWARDALAAAERGDYREAVHCAYWASIVRLEALDFLAKDRARTPRESLRLLTAHPKEHALLSDITSHFELIWYGYRPASEADWSGAKVQLEKIGCLTPSMPATATS